MHKKLTSKIIFTAFFTIFAIQAPLIYALSTKNQNVADQTYNEYLDFFEEVYMSMDANYYKTINRKDFKRFIKKFDKEIYGKLKNEGKSNDYIRWRSAAFLVDHLKASEDIFSAFYPPKPAKDYEEKVLGKKIDLGIEGVLNEEGYLIDYIEPRSDAYVQGLREKDIIVTIDDQKTLVLDNDLIAQMLIPDEGATLNIRYVSFKDQKEKEITVTSQEYFRQTVFLSEISLPGIYCLEIQKFNRKTSDDLFRYLSFLRTRGEIKGLILDLRNNPGGPPLAAREISSFFLPANDEFAVFKKRGDPIAVLDVPEIPEQLHYDGPMVILVNEESGSASELFSGILQKRGRAILMGTKSAGHVLLKSMYHFSDDSMLLLVTARGHYPDGDPFSFNGLKPNRYIKEKKDEPTQLVKIAAAYLIKSQQN